MIRVLAILLILPAFAKAEECYKLTLAAHVCLENQQMLRAEPLVSADGATQLVEVILPPDFPNDVFVSFFALRSNEGNTVSDWSDEILETQASRKGRSVTQHGEFRHRGVRGYIVKIYQNGETGKPIWGAYLGVEVSDGVVQLAISRRQEASLDEIGQWSEVALSALFPRGGN